MQLCNATALQGFCQYVCNIMLFILDGVWLIS